jgi:hypothetical protein
MRSTAALVFVLVFARDVAAQPAGGTGSLAGSAAASAPVAPSLKADELWLELHSNEDWYFFGSNGVIARSPGNLAVKATANQSLRVIARKATFGSVEGTLTWDGASGLIFKSADTCNYGWAISIAHLSKHHFSLTISSGDSVMSCSPAGAMSRDRYSLQFTAPATESLKIFVLFDDGSNWVHPYTIAPGKTQSLSIPFVLEPDVVMQRASNFDCAVHVGTSGFGAKFHLVVGGKDVPATVNPPAGSGSVPISCDFRRLP